MSFGKNLQFWLRIVLTLLKVVVGYMASTEKDKGELGPLLVKAILDSAARLNSDDHAQAAPADAA